MTDEQFGMYQEMRSEIEWLIAKGVSKDEILTMLQEDLE